MTTVTPMQTHTAPGRVIEVGEWSERVAGSFAPARIADVDSSFFGTMQSSALDDVHVSRVQVAAHVVERTERHIDPRQPARYVLCVQLDGGRSMVMQDGREALLSPGDVTIYDTSRPYTLLHEDRVNCIGVVIPSQRVSIAESTLGRLTATVMPGSDFVTATSAQTVTRFQEGLAGIAGPTRHRLGQTFVGLFETVCMSWASQHAALEIDPRAELREAVLRYINQHLADPDLTPQRISDAHYISLRSLHSLAKQSGASVAGWIRGRRLERCRADLADPSLAHITVAEIGARWGFTHPPHFTTLFRTQFGATPSAYRKTALA